MRLRLLLFIQLLAITYFTRSSGVASASSLTAAESGKSFLRAHASRDADLLLEYDEERFGAMDAIGMVGNAVKMKSKMKMWLVRGVDPADVLKKLKVASEEDANFKYYSRYFYQYMVKYPSKIPKNIPTSLLDEIMKARSHHWLYKKNYTPPQIFKELGMTGTYASQKKHPNYKYFIQYHKMWSDEQYRLSPKQPPKLDIVI